MRVIIAAGGTGGTLYPGIALAQALTRRLPKVEAIFVGAGRDIERMALRGRPWKLITMVMPRIKNQTLVGRLGALVRLPFVMLRAFALVLRLQPALAIGIGGYAAGPVPLAAALLGVPMVIVVPDTIPGLANRLLARFARRIFLGFDDARRFFPTHKVVVTGNPVRDEVLHVRDVTPIDRDSFTIFCFGGSQGATHMNQAMVDALPRLRSFAEKLYVIHHVGMRDDIDHIRRMYRENNIRADVHPFIEQIWEQYAKADIVVARSGASTIAELTVLKKPAILIPYPYAADDHQRVNAESMVRQGGAIMILEQELTGERLASDLQTLILEPQRLTRMHAALEQHARVNAADRIVEECEKLMKAA